MTWKEYKKNRSNKKQLEANIFGSSFYVTLFVIVLFTELIMLGHVFISPSLTPVSQFILLGLTTETIWLAGISLFNMLIVIIFLVIGINDGSKYIKTNQDKLEYQNYKLQKRK